MRASCIPGLDALGSPDLIDERAGLPKVTVPALARELHDLIPVRY
ncbi:hypothetical protein [Nocardia tenerifensis]|nr:hypothetical protein [Nocardia tenerifensis]